ncbi:MAG: polyprenyl synthetase family protein [Deltaproteobacteria bacterium]|nr:polyprenyl synthetase family protein [Deltaproteobacteria bacterium]
MDLKTYIAERRALVDQALDRYLPKEEGPAGEVMRAMRYSVFAGGKRVRPILCLAACEAMGGDIEQALPVACALECIHTYSLIHDDLPAMDDDDYRRGVPTCHKVFGEAMAILAGDGLLTFAFQLLSGVSHNAGRRKSNPLEATQVIARAAGVHGMVGGQVVDMASEGKDADAGTVRYIHTHKTAALIAGSIQAGALIAGGRRNKIESLGRYGEALGLAFQVVDDILDIEGDPKEMGKATGSDIRKKKATYPSVYGLEESRGIAGRLVEEAIDSLRGFGAEAEPLRAIAHYILDRKK